MLSLVHEVNNTKQKNKHKANFHYQTTLLKFLYNDMIDVFLTNILIFTPLPPPLKTPDNLSFSGVFRGFEMRV